MTRIKYRELLPSFFLIFLGLIFFFDVLFQGRVFFAGDNLTINLPSKVLFWNMIKQGQLPIWNPFTFSGTPFLADINLGLLSPFNLFYLLFPPLRALTYSIVFAVIFAGVSMYKLARELKMTSIPALLTAIVFMFSGTMMTHTMNTAILNSIAWLPLVFVYAIRLIETKNIKYALIVSILLSLVLFGGHIQYFYYIVALLSCYILFQGIKLKERLIYLFVIIIPSLFLSAVQLLPFLEYAQFSTRPVRDLAYASGSTPIVSFIHLLIPNFFGIMKDGTSWGATADINGYIGIIPLILATIAILKIKNRNLFFFAFISILTFFIALGKYSPFYLAAFYLLPFFSRFRSPASILILYTFSMAILSGYGAAWLFRRPNTHPRSSFRLMIGAGLGLLFSFIFFAVRFGNYSYAIRLMELVNSIKPTAFFTRFLEYSAQRAHTIFMLWTDNLAVAFFFVSLFVLFAYVYRSQKCYLPIQKILIVLLVSSELLFFAGNNYITADQSYLYASDSLVKFFKKDSSIYRVLTMMDPGAKPPFGDPGYFPDEAVKALDFIQPNTNLLMNREIVGGYASIVSGDYARYFSSSLPTDPTSIDLPHPDMKQLDELGVKYVITAGRYDKEISSNKKYRLVHSFYDGRIRRVFKIYQNQAAYPRVLTLNKNNESTGSASILFYSPTTIKVRINAPGATTLVLTNPAYPGWSAYKGSTVIPIKKYKIFQNISLSKADSEVVFKYEPWLFFAGALISIANWLYVLGFISFLVFKEHEEVRQKLHVRKPYIKNNS